MSNSDLLAAADHIRRCNEAEAEAEAKAPLRRTHAIIRIDAMLPLIGKSVNEARLGAATTSEFADKLEHIADMLDEVWAEANRL